ncbi:uncharacterized protein LOC130896116 isoform X1 [Diorhabda carinulata]|uniref:uncharacterized protein LOC130896116 isoform X1 n=1 Tax=Diorhabda carinulata TaxID=1163345 RepID=UPI0025A1E32C|nr:uncharacterized protein LOC130896116 isoform X1 [Diorhabda carinulata]XP_057659896.1 uncharacterized protein LOC130896116 isoform X1 [Diorhabda carinulata]
MAPPGIGNSMEIRSDTTSTEGRKSDSKISEYQKDIVVLDGGFATQLSCHVQQPIDGDVLWSSRFLATDPEAVIDTHLDFLRAGANLIITNTYQADVNLFEKHLNITKEEGYNLIKQSVQYAKTAVERYLEEYPNAREPLIVGSVGPYGASLHDGSEYTGSYAKTVSAEQMKEWHLPRMRALVEGGVDLFAIETIPNCKEAEMLVTLLKEEFPNIKAWLAFSVAQDGKSTAFGEDFKKVARHCFDLNPEQLVAVGINCTAPRLIEPLLTGINDDRKDNPRPLIVYPNSGENYVVELGTDASSWINRDKCEPVETYIQKWLDLGVTWVGGCCRTYATDVSRIKQEVQLWKEKQQ